MKFAILLLAATLTGVFASLGLDINNVYSSTVWDCFNSKGYTFVGVRCWRSVGKPDTNCPKSVEAANNVGIQQVDIYLFPCRHCMASDEQVNQLWKFTQDNNVQFGKMWLDIESPTAWGTNHADNQKFFEDMLGAATNTFGDQFGGIYSNSYEWTTIMGTTFKGGDQYPLWWAHYDNDPSLDAHWTNFGGWTKPTIKQYAGDKKVCGADVDLNVF
jgi:hypothetical protein